MGSITFALRIMVARGGQNDNNTKKNTKKLHLHNGEGKYDNKIPLTSKDKHWHTKYIEIRQFEAKRSKRKMI